MVELAEVDLELSPYIKAAQSTINHVKEEAMPGVNLLLEKKNLTL